MTLDEVREIESEADRLIACANAAAAHGKPELATWYSEKAAEQLRALDGACRPLIGRNGKPTNVCACGGSHEPPRQ